MTIVAPLLDASPTFFSPSLGIPTFASGPEEAPTYDIRTVAMTGALISDMPLAEPDTVTWTLNQPDAATFHFPKGAYGFADVGSLNGEVQIFRNGDLLTWGPVVGTSANGSKGQVDCSVVGCEWYLNRRFLDAPIVNHLSNGDFESGTSAWSANGGVSFSIDGGNYETGANSAQLTASGGGGYIEQSATFAPNGVGALITCSAWFFIDSFTAPANGLSFGLFAEAGPGGVTTNNYAINSASPQGIWTKASTTVWIPPGLTWTVTVRLYCPVGGIHWDDVKLVAMGSIGSNGVATDIEELIRAMIIHVQDAAQGKSNVNIGMNSTPTGVLMPKQWQFVDHVQFDQALLEFVQRDDGIDYSLDLTPTSRTFHQYAAKRGSDLTGLITLEYNVDPEATPNCTDYRFTQDAGTCVTRQIVLGSDNGPAREQGEAVDTSHIGGTILQDVHQASQDAEVSSLQPIAQELLARYSIVPELIEMDVVGAAGFVPSIHCGDLVNVLINDGWTQISDVRRIMQLHLDCPTNILTVTVAMDTL
jgi:hypothetical protein